VVNKVERGGLASEEEKKDTKKNEIKDESEEEYPSEEHSEGEDPLMTV